MGCNIVLAQVPQEGRIFFIKGGAVLPREAVIAKVQRTEFIGQSKPYARGWVLDVLTCVNRLPGG